MTRRAAAPTAGRLIPQPCFCGCGGIAVYGAAGAHYLPGHAPHERKPAAPARRVEAGAASLPYRNGGQADLFGPAPAGTRRLGEDRRTS